MKKGFLNTSLKKIGSLLLVATYLVAGISGPIHSFLAHENEAVTSCTEEENSCHRLLVHHDIENGCDHDSHVVSSDFECDLCSLAPSAVALIVEAEAPADKFFIAVSDISPIASIANQRTHLSELSRGPPVC